MSATHRTPGNLRAFVQVRMRNLRSGNSFDYRFSATEAVERAMLDTVQMEYLYSDADHHHFMNQESYEQLAMTDEVLGDGMLYLLPNSVIKVDMYEGNPVGIELPTTVALEVVETEPVMKGATASVSYKSSAISAIDGWKSPVFLVHGDDDRNVDFAQTVGLVQLLRARGIYYELEVVPDDLHESMLHRNWIATFGRMGDFLKRFVWNKEVATSGASR